MGRSINWEAGRRRELVLTRGGEHSGIGEKRDWVPIAQASDERLRLGLVQGRCSEITKQLDRCKYRFSIDEARLERELAQLRRLKSGSASEMSELRRCIERIAGRLRAYRARKNAYLKRREERVGLIAERVGYIERLVGGASEWDARVVPVLSRWFDYLDDLRKQGLETDQLRELCARIRVLLQAGISNELEQALRYAVHVRVPVDAGNVADQIVRLLQLYSVWCPPGRRTANVEAAKQCLRELGQRFSIVVGAEAPIWPSGVTISEYPFDL